MTLRGRRGEQELKAKCPSERLWCVYTHHRWDKWGSGVGARSCNSQELVPQFFTAHMALLSHKGKIEAL